LQERDENPFEPAILVAGDAEPPRTRLYAADPAQVQLTEVLQTALSLGRDLG